MCTLVAAWAPGGVDPTPSIKQRTHALIDERVVDTCDLPAPKLYAIRAAALQPPFGRPPTAVRAPMRPPRRPPSAPAVWRVRGVNMGCEHGVRGDGGCPSSPHMVVGLT
eukprot:365581-Chlamydomonas_euryale.AAC.7